MVDVDELLARMNLSQYARILSNVVKEGYWQGHKKGGDEVGAVFEEQDPYTIQALEDRTIELSERTQARLIGNLKESLMEGLKQREDISSIVGRVSEEFIGMRDWETERVVRTEVMTAVNTGRNDAWMKSRVVNWKVWWNPAVGSKRTGEDSKRMHGQIVKVDEQFVDPMDGSRHMMPPNRPNCRCTARPLRNLPEDIVYIAGQMYDKKMVRKEAKVYKNANVDVLKGGVGSGIKGHRTAKKLSVGRKKLEFVEGIKILQMKGTEDELEGISLDKVELGACYDNAGRYLLDHPYVDGKLVHGTAYLVKDIPLKFGHGWIELPGDKIFDGTANQFFRKADYYKKLKISKEKEYGYNEMIEMLEEHETWGPWHNTLGITK